MRLFDVPNALSASIAWGSFPFPWCACNPCSPKALERTFQQLGAAPRRRWGQNFLIDLAAQQRIVEAAGIQAADCVWEIGSGLGALTQHLWTSCRHLILFEIDPLLIEFYRSCLGWTSEPTIGPSTEGVNGKASCQLVAGDVVKTWPHTHPTPDIIIGNLPYNTASLILTSFAHAIGVTHALRPRCMVFTVQREIAGRLRAKVRSKPYSSFSVLLQSQFYIEHLFDLRAQLFYPKPNVVSSTVRLSPRQHGLSPAQVHQLEGFVRTLFSQRRKTIANNIKASQYRECFAELETKLSQAGIQCNQRAEEISVEQFLRLAQSL